jgi:hypothetical protein
MHHEDRAGVNSLIRGLDRISGSGLPVLVVLSTNRLEAIDPAVRRRAADTFIFVRLDQDQIGKILSDVLGEAGFDSGQCSEIAAAMARNGDQKYGYTYSDIYHRYFPTLLLDSFPDRPVSVSRALELAQTTLPTPPFRGSNDDEPAG